MSEGEGGHIGMADEEAVAILRHPHTLYNHSNLRIQAATCMPMPMHTH